MGEPPRIVLEASEVLPYGRSQVRVSVFGWCWFQAPGLTRFVSGRRDFDLVLSTDEPTVLHARGVGGRTSFRYEPRPFGPSAPKPLPEASIPRAKLPLPSDPNHPLALPRRSRDLFRFGPRAMPARLWFPGTGMAASVEAPVLPSDLGAPPGALWRTVEASPAPEEPRSGGT